MATTNNFLKEEVVMFDEVVKGFEEALVYSEQASIYPIDNESSNDTIWRPMPMQADTYEGLDQTGNFGGKTEMAVPVRVDRVRSAPGSINSKELRDLRALRRYGDAAKRKLASDVNMALRRQAVFYGSIVDTRAGAATGFDDVASLMAKFDSLGVSSDERMANYSTRDMVKMASDLASRQTLSGKTQTAYEKAYINEIAGFSLHTDPNAIMLPASTATGATVAAANQRHIPVATTEDAVGDKHNVDNRSMLLTVAATGGAFKVGDAFTIAGVYALHHESKDSTGELKTFRVVESVSPTSIRIVPAIVAKDHVGATQSETAYANVTTTPSSGAAITMLNKNAAYANTAFNKGAIELLPSKLAIDAKDGWATMQSTLANGLTLYYTRQGNIHNLSTEYRWDVSFGTSLLNPEMAGIQLFGQA